MGLLMCVSKSREQNANRDSFATDILQEELLYDAQNDVLLDLMTYNWRCS
jgi:hypothetical protein